MHLVDLYGYPYERRKGRPVHNFVRACVLLLQGELRFEKGEYTPSALKLSVTDCCDSESIDNSDLNELLDHATKKMQEPDPRDFKPGEHTCNLDVTAVKTCRACVDESRRLITKCPDCGNINIPPLPADAPCPFCYPQEHLDWDARAKAAGLRREERHGVPYYVGPPALVDTKPEVNQNKICDECGHGFNQHHTHCSKYPGPEYRGTRSYS